MRIEHGQRIRSVAIAGAAAGRQAPGAESLGAHLEANAAARACAVGCQTVVKSYKCVELYRSVNVFPVLCILFLFFLCWPSTLDSLFGPADILT